MGFSPLSSLFGRNPSQGGDHFDPDQPRVPKGQSRGGQWTSLSALMGATAEDSSAAEEKPRDAKPIRLAQAASSDANSYYGPVMLNPVILKWATSTFQRQLEQAKDGQLPVFEFKAREYRKGEGEELDLAGVRTLEREEAQRKCGRTSEIQELIDKSKTEVEAELGLRHVTRQVFGTRVHSELEDHVREFAEALKKNAESPSPGHVVWVRGLKVEIQDPRIKIEELQPERSYGAQNNEARRGEADSVRIDVSYKQGRTACMVDLKTGKRGLDGPRAAELAARAARDGTVDQVLVMEMRPFEK